MLFNNRSTRSSLLLIPFSVAMLLLAVACGSPAPAATPAVAATPTPTPTPTPRPSVSQPFIDLGPEATLRQVVDRLPQEQRACLEGRIPANDPGWDRHAFHDNGLETVGERDALECLNNPTMTGLLVATIYHQAGGLSTPTVTCIEGTFSGVDLVGLMAQEDGEGSREQVQQLFGSIVALLLCLTEEEASRVNFGGITGGEDGALTLQDMRCVLQRVDVNVLLDFFGMVENPAATPSLDDMERMLQLMRAFEACGVEMDFGVPAQR